MSEDQYAGLAESYTRANDTNLFNAYYARPAMLDLLGEVTERDVLDAGCGAGPLMAELRERGARVQGFDYSPEMIDIARRRLGAEAPVQVADLTQPLPYDSGSFDDVVASLVLHYFEDWAGPLAELNRVLRPGGRLLIAVNHPVIRPVAYPGEDYFAVTPYTEDYEVDGETLWLTFYHRPLSLMSEEFSRAGFDISVISEPPYSPDTPPELLPPDLGDRKAFLCFLFFVLTKR